MKNVGQIVGTLFLPPFAWVSGAYLGISLLGTIIFGVATMTVWFLLLKSLGK